MGYKQISLKLPPDYTKNELYEKIKKRLKISNFSYQIITKSLDARKKNAIHWELRLLINSEEIKGKNVEKQPELEIPLFKRQEKVIVVGSGPAGFFAAYVLQKAGIQTILVERGTEVSKRSREIALFEKTGLFYPKSNYAFGEGGAGTFSDGKLTSRSKKISKEKNFILKSYVEAGAPEEILYLSHPHLGTDKLKIIVKNLRQKFLQLGGKIFFETQMINLIIKNNQVTAIETNHGILEANFFIIAHGHSAYETYRLLIRNGVPFHTKNFAIGTRMEHRQELINKAQWGVKKLKGVKAAEYRLTSPADGKHPVYSFCMCPGGIIVPSTAYQNKNIVNGMSHYLRNGPFANAAIVAAINLNQLLRKEVSALEALEWLEKLEENFFQQVSGYKAPYCSIRSFLNKKIIPGNKETSFPMGIVETPLWELFPIEISRALQIGLQDFTRKIKGFENGNILGLESKTSAPIQVDRDKKGKVAGFENLYVAGEGSGYSGGIISSAADGIKTAIAILQSL